MQASEDSENLFDAPMTKDQVLEYVLRASANASDALADRSRERVLEVTQVFGDSVLQVRHFPKERTVTVGGAASDFAVAVDELSQTKHPLFAHDGEAWVCSVEPAWPAFLESVEGRVSFADLVARGRARRDAEGRVHLGFGEAERVVVHVGAVAFCAQTVFPSKRVVPVKHDPDHTAAAIVGFVSFCAAMLGFALAFVPSPPKTSKMEEIERIVTLYMDQKPPEPPKPAAPQQRHEEKAPGAEGTASPEYAERRRLTRQELDRQTARTAGILGALQDNAELASMLGETGLNSAITTGVGSLIGSRHTSNGIGLGERGPGLGGGGRTASIGDFGPKTRPGGEWGGEFGEKKGGTLNPVGEPIVLGSLDKSQIDAVIKRNLALIKTCYQRELQKNPGLGGKVSLKFVIAKDGSVSSATTRSSTLNNPAVESCINGRFLRFTFPEPKGGGIVMVTYPFIFAPG